MPDTATLQDIADLVDTRWKHPLILGTFVEVQKEVAALLDVVDRTARKYLREAVDAGLVMEIKPHCADWAITLPGDESWELLSVYARLNGYTTLSTDRPPANSHPAPVALSFVASPRQQAEILRIYAEEWEAIERRRNDKRRTERAIDREAALGKDPELMAVLDRLGAALPGSDTRGFVVRATGRVKPEVDIATADAAVFAEILAAGLDTYEARHAAY